VTGGTGAEREAMVRAFHRASPLGDRPFLALDGRHDAVLLQRALRFWLHPACGGGGLNPLSAAEGGTLFLDRLERLSVPTQRQLLLLVRRLQWGDKAAAGSMPGRLAAGSAVDLDGALGAGVIADLLDCLDKIRVRAGRRRRTGAEGGDAGPDLPNCVAR